jgi:hypothetical protein
MKCRCASSNKVEVPAEMILLIPGLKNLGKPHILTFSQALVCLDCGSSQFTIRENELGRLREGIAPSRAA